MPSASPVLVDVDMAWILANMNSVRPAARTVLEAKIETAKAAMMAANESLTVTDGVDKGKLAGKPYFEQFKAYSALDTIFNEVLTSLGKKAPNLSDGDKQKCRSMIGGGVKSSKNGLEEDGVLHQLRKKLNIASSRKRRSSKKATTGAASADVVDHTKSTIDNVKSAVDDIAGTGKIVLTVEQFKELVDGGVKIDVAAGPHDVSILAATGNVVVEAEPLRKVLLRTEVKVRACARMDIIHCDRCTSGGLTVVAFPAPLRFTGAAGQPARLHR